MNQEINKKYEIKFRNEILKFKGFPATLTKNTYTISYTLMFFLDEWYSVDEIDEDLLPPLYDPTNDGTSSETVGVYIKNGEARLYSLIKPSSSPLNPDLVLPVIDLIEIIKNWREFLLQKPSNWIVLMCAIRNLYFNVRSEF